MAQLDTSFRILPRFDGCSLRRPENAAFSNTLHLAIRASVAVVFSPLQQDCNANYDTDCHGQGTQGNIKIDELNFRHVTPKRTRNHNSRPICAPSKPPPKCYPSPTPSWAPCNAREGATTTLRDASTGLGKQCGSATLFEPS